MGRRKIEIQPITTERNRSITFQKRKNGLFKKAYELGVLCSVDIAVVIFERGRTGEVKCYEYSSEDLSDIVLRRMSFQGAKETRTTRDFAESKLDGEDDEDEDEDAGTAGKKPAHASSSKSKAKVKSEDAVQRETKPTHPLSFERSSAPPPQPATFQPDLETLKWLAGLQLDAQTASHSPPRPEWLPSLPPAYSEVAGLSRMLGSLAPPAPDQHPFPSFPHFPPDPNPQPSPAAFAWPTHAPGAQREPNIGISKLSLTKSLPSPDPDLSWLELLSSVPASSSSLPHPSASSSLPHLPPSFPSLPISPSAPPPLSPPTPSASSSYPRRKRPRADTDVS